MISQVFFKKCPAFPFPEIGSISMISQFHDFLARFYYLAQLCAAAGMILKSISRKHNGFPPIVWHQLCPRSSALWSKNSASHNYGDLSLTYKSRFDILRGKKEIHVLPINLLSSKDFVKLWFQKFSFSNINFISPILLYFCQVKLYKCKFSENGIRTARIS